MAATHKVDAPTRKADVVTRLRLEVYDALAAKKGATTVKEQADLHDMHRGHLYRIRSGERQVSLSLAMRMATDLETTVEALFERRAA